MAERLGSAALAHANAHTDSTNETTRRLLGEPGESFVLSTRDADRRTFLGCLPTIFHDAICIEPHKGRQAAHLHLSSLVKFGVSEAGTEGHHLHTFLA